MEKEGRWFYEKVRPLLGSGAISAILDCVSHPCSGWVPDPVQSAWVKHKETFQGVAQNPKPLHQECTFLPAWVTLLMVGTVPNSCTGLWVMNKCNNCLCSSSNTVFASLQALCKDSSHSAACRLPLRMSHFTFKRPKSPFPTVHKLIFNSNPEQELCVTAAWTWSMRPGVWWAPQSDSIKQHVVIKAQQRATLPLRNSIPVTTPALIYLCTSQILSGSLKFPPQHVGRGCPQKTLCSGLQAGQVWAAHTPRGARGAADAPPNPQLPQIINKAAWNSGSISTQKDACWSQRSSESHHYRNCLRGSVWGARQPLQHRSLANSTICLQELHTGALCASPLFPGTPCSFLHSCSWLCYHKVSAGCEPGSGKLQPRFSISQSTLKCPARCGSLSCHWETSSTNQVLQKPGLYPFIPVYFLTGN